MHPRKALDVRHPTFEGMSEQPTIQSRLRTISSGLVAASVVAAFAVSFALLIHGSAPAGAAPVLVVLFLAGAAITNLIVTWRTSLRGAVLLPQGPPAAMISAALVGILPLVDAENRFGTALGFVALATGLSGVTMLILGWTRRGALLTRIPAAVTGGILAGAGIILMIGGARIASDQYRWSIATVISLLTALAFAALFAAFARRRPGTPLFPLLIVVTFGLFHLVLASSGITLATARANGLIFDAASAGFPLPIGDLGRADLMALVRGLPGLVMAVLTAVVALGLNTRAVGLLRKTTPDIDRELRVAGLANVLASPTTVSPSYHGLGIMAIALRARAISRSTAIVVALSCLALIPLAGFILGVVPTSLVGGLLLAIGASLVVDWYFDAARTMRSHELIVMSTIAVSIALGWFAVTLALLVAGVLALRYVEAHATT